MYIWQNNLCAFSIYTHIPAPANVAHALDWADDGCFYPTRKFWRHISSSIINFNHILLYLVYVHGRHFCHHRLVIKIEWRTRTTNAIVSITHKFQLEHKTPNTFFILHLFDPGDLKVSLVRPATTTAHAYPENYNRRGRVI